MAAAFSAPLLLTAYAKFYAKAAPETPTVRVCPVDEIRALSFAP